MIQTHSNPVGVGSRVESSERSLLGGLLQAGADRDRVLERVRPTDFSTDAHQTVARAIRDLWLEQEPIELTTVFNRLERGGSVKNLGERAWPWLVDLYVAGTSALDMYAEQVLDASRRRQLAELGRQMIRDAAEPDGPAGELIDRASGRLAALADHGRGTSRLVSSAEAINRVLENIDRRARGDMPTGVPTGLEVLDQMTGGLMQGGLTILAARPSVGKTALALQIARNAAMEGFGVLFASLEQNTEELAERKLAAAAKVCSQVLHGGLYTAEERQRTTAATDPLRSLNLHYDDTPAQSALHVLTEARKLKRQNGLGLVVVDYLQLVGADDPRASRNDQLDVITRRVRDIGKELGVAVLALSQLSRDCEKQNRRPRLSDLRDSGALEQHADAVLMLHRLERTGGDVDPVELGVEKQRNGPTGVVNLSYRRRVLTFESRMI
jgi:replicative DNA helicase